MNSGATSQAALTQSAVNQSNYASLDEAEADALAENALAQSTLTTEYNNAIAAAQASGDSALAQALYQEYVRLDESAQSQYATDLAQSNYENEFNYGVSQDALAQSNYENELALSQSSESQSYAYSIATTMLAQGIMPDSTTLATAGISTADAQAIVDAYAAQQASYSSSSSGTSGTSYEEMLAEDTVVDDYEGLYKAALASGNPSNYIAQYYADYGFTKSTGLEDGYETWLDSGGTTSNYDYVSEALNELKSSGYSFTQIMIQLENAKNAGLITDSEYSQLYSYWSAQWTKEGT